MTGLTFEVREDLVHGELTEDGDRVVRSIFYVVAEAPNGRRFANHVTPRETVANAAMMDLAAGRAAFDAADWEEIEPAYGSRSYSAWESVHGQDWQD